MDMECRYEANGNGVIHETIDGEAVIINLMSGRYYSIQGSGAEIWNLIHAKASIGQAARWLAQRYALPETDMQNMVTQFLAQLVQEELIRPLPSSQGESPGNVDLELPAAEISADHPFARPALRTYTDMQDLLLLDPIHELDDAGWPMERQEPELDG